jgi:hypothetical protein
MATPVATQEAAGAAPSAVKAVASPRQNEEMLAVLRAVQEASWAPPTAV